MDLKNLMICGIDKDAKSDKIIYYCKNLDSPYLDDFEIKERGRKYPSDFFNTVLMTNGHLIYENSQNVKWTYDYEYISQYLPLVFTAVFDRCAFLKGDKLRSEIWSDDLYVIPNLEVIQMAKLQKTIENRGDGI